MPLSKKRNKERMREARQIYCNQCSLAVGYPDGRLRCSLNLRVVQPKQPGCDKRKEGKPRFKGW